MQINYVVTCIFDDCIKVVECKQMLTEKDIKDYGDLSTKQPSVNDIQYGGDHYKKYGSLQPWDVITAWGLGYLDGTALKYIARWKDKNGIEDLKKAIHFLQKTIEVHEKGTK